jgi:hypothetical protein
MKKSGFIRTSLILLFVLIIIIISSTGEGKVWASSKHQTVPKLTPTTEFEPVEEPSVGDGDTSFFGDNFRENLSLIIGLGFCILISGGLIGGLIAWWILRNRDEEEDEEGETGREPTA